VFGDAQGEGKIYAGGRKMGGVGCKCNGREIGIVKL
jgi:hypothetical protein